MIEEDLPLGCCSICQPGLTTGIVLTTYISLYLCVGLFRASTICSPVPGFIDATSCFDTVPFCSRISACAKDERVLFVAELILSTWIVWLSLV